MSRNLRPSARFVIFLFIIASSRLFPAPSASLERTGFTAAGGSAETLLHVQDLGRYAIVSQGNLGAKIELVDRMMGTVASKGTASGVGADSGRIDSFLEPGDYKLRITKPESGSVTLAVRPFTTVNAGKEEADVPILNDRQTVRANLHDFELLSYWVKVDASDPTLVVEMEGRSLSDAAVWKDGAWDTGLRPIVRTYEPAPGKPITCLEFNGRVDPGTYLLICVGGPRKVWAEESTAETFSVTRGYRYLGQMGLMNVTFGEGGREGYLVSGRANYFEMEAKNNKGYLIATASASGGASRFDFNRSARIDSKSVSYRAGFSGSSGLGTQWLTLQGPPGETVEVRWFPTLSGTYDPYAYGLAPGRTSTPYMATALASAAGEDSIDMTALMVNRTNTGSTYITSANDLRTIGVGPGEPLHRKLNVLSPLSFLLQVKTAGSYGIFEKPGVGAVYRFWLLDDWLTRTRTALTPTGTTGGANVQLQAKIYVVTLMPNPLPENTQSGAGILDFALISSAEAVNSDAVLSSPPPAVENGLFWPSLSSVSTEYGGGSLLFGMRTTIPMGLSARAFPLDLGEPVLIRIEARGTVRLPFENENPVRLFSPNSFFSSRTVRVDDAEWDLTRDVPAGSHTLSVSNSTESEQWYLIGSVSAASMARYDPPKPGALESLLPLITEGVSQWRDFERGELSSYLLKVTETGSYRIATSGRLAMSITVRTALRTNLFSVSQNADGRNAVITSYLRPGIYLVNVRAEANTKGRAGVLLQKLDIANAGTLTRSGVLRNTVPEGALLEADLRIDKEELYRLDCLGLGRSFAYRFEDEGGWPIGQPTSTGTLTARLMPGTYHYISAADQVPTRRLLTLELAPDSSRDAYDPKTKLLRIEPNRSYFKVWVETPGRTEDVFTFEIPAQLHVVLYLTEGMEFKVVNQKGAAVIQGTGGKAVEADLDPGTWRILVKSSEEDNLRQYQILLAANELYDGAVRALSAPPSMIPLSVGKTGTVEIWSFGTQEAEALILDSANRVVARGETIPDDWNFRIVANLTAGRYNLVILPVGSSDTAPPSEVRGYENDEDEGGYEEEGEYYEEGGDYWDDYYPEEPAPSSAIVPAMSPPEPGTAVVRLISRAGISLAPSSGSIVSDVEIGNEVVSTSFSPKASGVFRFDAVSDAAVSTSVSRKGKVLASGVCPVFLPLVQGASYEIRFWHSAGEKKKVAFKAGQEKSTDVTLSGQEESVNVKDAVLKVRAILAAGFSVTPETATILYSPGADIPFSPVAGESVGTLSGTGWVIRPDGSPVGRVTVSLLTLGSGIARAFRVGAIPQSYGLSVPPKTAAVVRTDNSGRLIGLSATPAAFFRPDVFDWRGASVTGLTTAVGLRTGSFRGKLWDASVSGGQATEVRAGVSASFYPITSETALALGRRVQAGVASRSAISFTPGASRQSVKISLESGMAAFAWVGGKPAGFLDARGEDLTGVLEARGGSITVVNESGRSAICTVEAMVSQAHAALGETAGFESILGEPRSVSFTSSTRSSLRIFLWGRNASARFLREDDGKIYIGEPVSTSIGPVLSFPGGKGVLEVTAGGALRIWAAKQDALLAGFVGKGAVTRTSALGAAGAVLGQGAEAWSFTMNRAAIACLQATSGGVTAIYTKAGVLVAAAAGETARTLVASLPAGAYSAYTRPLKGGGQSGSLRLQILSPETIENEGVGAPVLMGPGERILFRFQVKAEGRIGAGIRAEREGLVATLFDQEFKKLDAGSIFIRSLPVGAYYLLVESPDETVRFSPVIYGLAGSRTATPEDIVKSYMQ